MFFPWLKFSDEPFINKLFYCILCTNILITSGFIDQRDDTAAREGAKQDFRTFRNMLLLFLQPVRLSGRKHHVTDIGKDGRLKTKRHCPAWRSEQDRLLSPGHKPLRCIGSEPLTRDEFR